MRRENILLDVSLNLQAPYNIHFGCNKAVHIGIFLRKSKHQIFDVYILLDWDTRVLI